MNESINREEAEKRLNEFKLGTTAEALDILFPPEPRDWDAHLCGFDGKLCGCTTDPCPNAKAIKVREVIE